MVFGSTKDASNIRKKDGKYITEDFIGLTLYYIMSELIDIQLKYKEYGEIVICFDDYKKTYWRRDIWPNYKLSRKITREKSDNPINYKEVYSYTNGLFEQIQKNTPWKCVYVNRAEADDIILVLAKEYSHEGVLILSPDKDFIQSQRSPNVKQYSTLTKKWIYPETKHSTMDEWIFEHVFTGDASDNVPKITDFTEFSENFIKHIQNYNSKNNAQIPLTVKAFKKVPRDILQDIISSYDIKNYNKKGEDIGLDIYKNKRFGPSDVKKITTGEYFVKKQKDRINEEIKSLRLKKKNITDKENRKEIQTKINALKEKAKNIKPDTKSVDERVELFLSEHELYKEHYERNFTLVMEEGIPDYIRANILMEYKSGSTSYNEEEFMKYLDSVNLGAIKPKLPIVFDSHTELDISNCGW